MAPPAALIASSAAAAAAAAAAAVAATGTGAGVRSSSPPLTWVSATRAGPRGSIALFWSAPAPGKLSVQSTVPANSVGTTVVPLFGEAPADVNVTEGGVPVWAKGTYVAGVAGVLGAAVTGAGIEIHHGSGTYRFER